MKIFGTCAEFRQLASGHWAASSLDGLKVSLFSFPQGAKPERFKFAACRPATIEERKEFAELHGEFPAPSCHKCGADGLPLRVGDFGLECGLC